MKVAKNRLQRSHPPGRRQTPQNPRHSTTSHRGEHPAARQNRGPAGPALRPTGNTHRQAHDQRHNRQRRHHDNLFWRSADTGTRPGGPAPAGLPDEPHQPGRGNQSRIPLALPGTTRRSTHSPGHPPGLPAQTRHPTPTRTNLRTTTLGAPSPSPRAGLGARLPPHQHHQNRRRSRITLGRLRTRDPRHTNRSRGPDTARKMAT